MVQMMQKQITNSLNGQLKLLIVPRAIAEPPSDPEHQDQQLKDHSVQLPPMMILALLHSVNLQA